MVRVGVEHGGGAGIIMRRLRAHCMHTTCTLHVYCISPPGQSPHRSPMQPLPAPNLEARSLVALSQLYSPPSARLAAPKPIPYQSPRPSHSHNPKTHFRHLVVLRWPYPCILQPASCITQPQRRCFLVLRDDDAVPLAILSGNPCWLCRATPSLIACAASSRYAEAASFCATSARRCERLFPRTKALIFGHMRCMQNAWGLARHEAAHFCLILL